MELTEHQAAEKLYVALDYPDIYNQQPQELLQDLKGTGVGVKIGLEITAARGWLAPIDCVFGYGFNTFADAKLHDIGNTVSKAAHVILNSKPQFLNVHASSSKAALSALVAERDKTSPHTKLLGVSVLTDVDQAESIEDYRRGRKAQVLHFTDKVLDQGLDGVVCSPEELRILAKYERFSKIVKMIPAIRPKWSVANDQKNFTTPTEAIERGATHLVVGRPITEQYKMIGKTPLDAFRAVVEEIKEAA